MPAFEVSRTLVKSPPEVWSELEKAERLAELLGDDSIAITRAVPESTIEWRGANAGGTIEIKAGGWGTKVRLTAEVAEPIVAEPVVAEPVVVADEPLTSEPLKGVLAAETTDAEPTETVPTEAVPKSGLWRRVRNMFAGEPPTVVEAADPPETADESAASATEDLTEDGTEAVTEAVTDPTDDEATDDEATPDRPPGESQDFEAVLNGVLDHLGSAHKRPFSAV